MITNVRKELRSLTSLRFIAAFMIVVHHFSGYFHWYWYGVYPLGSGVTFFFVLSGFVLQYSYPKIETSDQVRRFIWLRFARLWPLHILCLAAPLALISYDRAVVSQNPEFLLFHVSMLQSWIPIQISTFNLNGPAWSISTEMFFYLMFPVLLWVRSFWGWSIVAFIIGIFFIASYTVGCIGSANLPGTNYSYTGLSCYTAAQAFPVFRLPEFILGMLICRFFVRIPNSQTNLQEYRFSLIEGAALIVCAVFLYYLNDILSTKWFDAIRETLIFNVIRLAAPAPLFGLIILVFAMDRGHISRFLSTKIFVLFGEISFSLYLIHVTIIKLLLSNPQWIEGYSMWTVFAGYVIAGMAISYLTYMYFERPIRNWARTIGLNKIPANQLSNTTLQKAVNIQIK